MRGLLCFSQKERWGREKLASWLSPESSFLAVPQESPRLERAKTCPDVAMAQAELKRLAEENHHDAVGRKNWMAEKAALPCQEEANQAGAAKETDVAHEDSGKLQRPSKDSGNKGKGKKRAEARAKKEKGQGKGNVKAWRPISREDNGIH